MAQNGEENSWKPGLWSQFAWTWSEAGELFYCQGVFGASTEQDAMDAELPDTADLEGGCSGFPWSELRVPLTLTGEYSDAYGSSHTIDEWGWGSASEWGASSYRITQYDGDGQWVVAQNDSANSWNPDLWSRFNWTIDADGGLHYCQAAYDAATEKDALAAADADSADLAAGCGGFGWTELRRSLAIEGRYEDDYDSIHEIDAWSWTSSSSWGTSSYSVSQFDNDAGWIVAQNGADNSYNPDLWSRFNWTSNADGQLFYCQIAYGEKTEKAALAVADADAADLKTGCSGFSWTALHAAPAD